MTILARLAATLLGVSACSAAADGATPVASERWVVASQSSVPSELLHFYAHTGAECLASTRCPFQGAPVPACSRLDAEAPTLDKVGKQIRIRGTARARPSRNTQQNCTSTEPCCQTVWGNIAIETTAGSVTLSATEFLPRLEDPYTCVGDRSALCCGFAAMAREVVASGTLHALSYRNAANEPQRDLFLVMDGFCQVGQAEKDATNLSKIDL